jgi:hypothetical protein
MDPATFAKRTTLPPVTIESEIQRRFNSFATAFQEHIQEIRNNL